ncbi:MAG TPA: hypothetical protein DCS30_00105 [Rhizobiales bacterium]|nr:hypothetical protein [Hyphomicrobiales bacterium]
MWQLISQIRREQAFGCLFNSVSESHPIEAKLLLLPKHRSNFQWLPMLYSNKKREFRSWLLYLSVKAGVDLITRLSEKVLSSGRKVG